MSPGLHIASNFSSSTTLTLTYYRGTEGVSRNGEQYKHITSLTCFKMTLLAVPNSSFNAPLLKSDLHKAHMIKLFRRAQRTDTLRVANRLSEFGKVVFIHIKVSLVSGICHTIGGNIEEQYLHKQRKRNQKHDNKVTYL